jgi:hypothetical protein
MFVIGLRGEANRIRRGQVALKKARPANSGGKIQGALLLLKSSVIFVSPCFDSLPVCDNLPPDSYCHTRSKTNQTTMKTKLWIPALSLSLAFAACDSAKTTTDKMDAGVDKVASGVKEMAKAAGESADKATEGAKATIDKVSESADAATANAKAQMNARAAEIQERLDAVAEKMKEDMKPAAEAATKAAADAKAKVDGQ